MKRKTIAVAVVLFCFLMGGAVFAGTLGDVNGDQKVGLAETVYSLQVTAGMRPEVSTPVLNWRGNWLVNTAYKEDYVVLYNNVLYYCILQHTSTAGNAPPYKGTWMVLAEPL